MLNWIRRVIPQIFIPFLVFSLIIWRARSAGIWLMLLAVGSCVALGGAFESESKKPNFKIGWDASSCIGVVGWVSFQIIFFGRGLFLNSWISPPPLPESYCVSLLLGGFEIGFIGGLILTHHDKFRRLLHALRHRKRR